MTQYAGDPDAFPLDLPLPDDSAAPTAAEVNPFLEGLADRTAYLRKRLGQIGALTFHTDILTTPATFDVVRYCDATQKWHGMSSIAADYFVSTQQLLVWPGTTEIPAPQQTGDVPWDFDIDADGNAVLIDHLIDTTRSRTAAGVWALSFGDGDATSHPAILWEPVTGNWIIAFQVAGAEIIVRTSTDLGVTHTNRTEPTFTASSEVTMGTDGAGRVVMQAHGGTATQFSYSDDGGVTWSAPTTHALGFTYAAAGGRHPRPVFNGSAWVAVGMNSTTGVTRVFKSSDGITWTTAASLASLAVAHIAGIGGVVMGTIFSATTALNGGIVVSADDGVTWRKGEGVYSFSSVTPRDVAATDSRFIILANGRIFPGVGFGEGGEVVT